MVTYFGFVQILFWLILSEWVFQLLALLLSFVLINLFMYGFERLQAL